MISCLAPVFTVSSLFVTRRIIQTVTATVVDTVVTVGTILTLYNKAKNFIQNEEFYANVISKYTF